jgi:hypothetical protein
MSTLEKLLNLIPDKRSRNVAFAVSGMGALITGQKVVALAMFGKGARGLEECWREAHPDFRGGLQQRWQKALDFYESTHTHPANRKLHVIGIPIILGGAAGLLIFSPFRPLWFVSAGAFASGWALNILGHAAYEKNTPAFADDPLAFVAGPAWDFKAFLDRRKEASPVDSDANAVNVGGEPATA